MAPTKKPLRNLGESTTDGDTDVPGVRVLALRKERSRDAARSRRSRENVQYLELAKLLPLPSAITSQLDKASVIRLTISFLKFRNLENGETLKKDKHEEKQLLPARPGASAAVFEKDAGVHVLQALDGFLFAVSGSGKFLYVSETVSTYLGLSQVELIGSSIFSYIHEDDQVQFSKLLTEALGLGNDAEEENSGEESDPAKKQRSIKTFIRMKCALVKRGGSYTKTIGYKVIQIVGRAVPYKAKVPGEKASLAMVAVGNPLPLPTVCELRVQSHAFISRVGLDLKIVYCEGKINRFMDFTARDIVGLSAYEFYHLDDMTSIQTSHDQCVKAGQTVTSAYRWMNKDGGWVWMLTHATIVKRNSEDGGEEFQILCVNHVISDVEHKGVVMHGIQSYFQNKREAITGIGIDFDDCELSSEKRKTTVPLPEHPVAPVTDDFMDDIMSDSPLTDENFPSPGMFEEADSPQASTSFDFKVPNNNNNEMKRSNSPNNIPDLDVAAADIFSAVGLTDADLRKANLGPASDPITDLVNACPDGNYWNSLFGEDTSLVEELMEELQRVEDESYGMNPKYEGFSSCQENRIPQPLAPPQIPTPASSLPSVPNRQMTGNITRAVNLEPRVPQNRTVNRQGQLSQYPTRPTQIQTGNIVNQQGHIPMMTPPNPNVVVNGNNLMFDNRMVNVSTNSELNSPLSGFTGNAVTANGQIKTENLNDSETTLFNARFNDLTLRNNSDYNPMNIHTRIDYQPNVRELKGFAQLRTLPEFQARQVPFIDQIAKPPPPYQEAPGNGQIPPPLRHFSFTPVSPTVNWMAP